MDLLKDWKPKYRTELMIDYRNILKDQKPYKEKSKLTLAKIHSKDTLFGSNIVFIN